MKDDMVLIIGLEVGNLVTSLRSEYKRICPYKWPAYGSKNIVLLKSGGSIRPVTCSGYNN